MAAAQTYLERAAGEARGGDAEAAAGTLRAGLAEHPADEALSAALGRLLRLRRALPAARAVLKAALEARPQSLRVAAELAEVELAAGDAAAAVRLLEPLLAQGRADAGVLAAAAGAWRMLGDRDRATSALERALELSPRDAGLWRRREILAREAGDEAGALAVLERAGEALPDDAELAGRRIAAMSDAGRRGEAVAALEAAIAADADAGWAHLQLGRLLQGGDRARANVHLRRALALSPDDVEAAVALANSLKETRGADEAAHLQEAAELIAGLLPRLPPGATAIAADVLWRTGQYEAVDRLGSFESLGRYWAANGAHTALLQQFARVASDADRRELVEQHRIWGERASRPAAARPIAPPAPRARRERIRLGFLSSDLRRHPVAYFVEPLFAQPDPRFELFAYSAYPGPAGDTQRWFEARAAVRDIGPLPDRAAAERIAADGLDLLVELGGTTRHNRPGVLPFRPARVQASWLGYPHSLGLAAIDRFVADPFMAPAQPELMIEQPLLMPASWICMAPRAFPDEPPVAAALPADRTGVVTFGTAANSYKYNPRLLRTWARTLAATPGSRFMIVRPEAGTPALQANIARHFAAEGVGAERLVFRAARGRHETLYEDIDISLDTFPQTGGTTTCEALWMGVPVVSLVGEAVFERLSYSILTNAGLGDLVAPDEDAFVRLAAELARDRPRLLDLRRTLRGRIRASPPGQVEAFTHDFYALMAQAAGG